MSSRLYETFCDLLESVPVKAVIRAADAERRMVQDDLRYKRSTLDEDSFSVLEFCTFLVNGARGLQSAIPVLPTEHVAFYRKVVQRLIDAGELPRDVTQWFDRTALLSLGASSR